MKYDEMIPITEGGEERVKAIFEVKKDVERYTFYKRSLDLGIRYGKRDLTFTEFMLFSFIKEAFDG